MRLAMRIVLLAWCAGTAAACVRGARAGGADPAALFTATDAAPPLRGPALSGVPVHIVDAGLVDADLVAIRAARPDLVLVTGWPRRLPAALNDAAPLGAINVHPSLLPRHRGRAPVFWTILSGDATTGVTLHRLEPALDAGPIVLQRSLAVPARATSAGLERLLDTLAGELVEHLCRFGVATHAPIPQQGAPTRAPAPTPGDGLLHWTDSAVDLDRRIRACDGAVDATTSYQGMKLVVLAGEARTVSTNAPPATIVAIEPDAIVASTANGQLALQRFAFLHRIWSAGELAQELRLEPGARFGAG
jgi:methionyl-tRNA formyltransferase